MLVVTLANIYLLVLIAGLIGVYIFPALLLCFALNFSALWYFCRKVRCKIEQDLLKIILQLRTKNAGTNRVKSELDTEAGGSEANETSNDAPAKDLKKGNTNISHS